MFKESNLRNIRALAEAESVSRRRDKHFDLLDANIVDSQLVFPNWSYWMSWPVSVLLMADELYSIVAENERVE